MCLVSGEAEGLLAKANAKASAVRLVANAIAKQVHHFMLYTPQMVYLHFSRQFYCWPRYSSIQKCCIYLLRLSFYGLVCEK